MFYKNFENKNYKMIFIIKYFYNIETFFFNENVYKTFVNL